MNYLDIKKDMLLNINIKKLAKIDINYNYLTKYIAAYYILIK